MNDTTVALDANGAFSHTVPVTYGPNVLSFAASDSEGHARDRVQSFLWSSEFRLPTTPNEGMSPLGLGIYLDQEALDDGDPTDGTDDLATIVQAAVGNLDLTSLFDSSTPIANEAGYNIYLTSLLVTTTSASLDAIDDGDAVIEVEMEPDGLVSYDGPRRAVILAAPAADWPTAKTIRRRLVAVGARDWDVGGALQRAGGWSVRTDIALALFNE